MRCDQAVEDATALGQVPQRPDLVSSHQAAITLDVSRKNRDQPALGINWFCQMRPLNPLTAYRGTKWRDTPKMGRPLIGQSVKCSFRVNRVVLTLCQPLPIYPE